ncbi:hypothetical protein EIP91_000622 [Steccherinum ochraceum]|uniref:Uncharacterized protein n=1 Tax=Steccherinum ochraceum TaxID=92696 RepID=A0A4R0RFH4_9APHY|nr:hypothetical protein EIP91_000622 [Steccherinum ochraceum]
MKLLIPALVFSGAAVQGCAQQVPFHVNKIITPGLSQFIDNLREEWDIPGLNIIGAWGIKDENGAKTTADTSFILASCSKAFLSAAMGILMDDFAQGKNVTALPPKVKVFDWNTKVADLLPGQWQLADEWATKKANISLSLSHVIGVTRHDYSPSRTDALIDVLLNLKTSAPRSSYASNSHMAICPFDQRVLWDALRSIYVTDDTTDLITAAGGVISDAVDMTQWMKMLLNKGVNPDTNTTVVPKSAFEAVTTPHPIFFLTGNPRRQTLSSSGMEWDGVARLTRATTPQVACSPQVTAELSLPIEAYAGTYEDAGYGTITLCALSSTSSECRHVLNAFTAIHNITTSENRRTLYAEYGSVWSSYMRFRHVGGDNFQMMLMELFPHGYGKDTTPFEVNYEGINEAAVTFELDEDGSRVLAFGFMGTEEEQEGRTRLLRNTGVEYSISAAAQVVLTRIELE